MTPRLHHVAISTPDADRLGAFYRDLLGVRTTYARDPDGNVVELKQLSSPSHPVALPAFRPPSAV